MYTLHIANKNYSSWSLRPWVLMKTLDIPFEERLMVFREGSNWEPFRAFSPAGLVPCLHDGATVVWDSLAIAEYLAERHPGVWPADAVARSWARCAAAEMHSGFSTLRGTCTMNCGLRIRLRETGAALRANLDRLGELWNEGLQRFGGPFLAGRSFTAADAFYAPVAFRIQTYDLRLPGAAAPYAARLLAMPAMQEWYAAALRETWREQAHEAEALEVGTVLEDLRAQAPSP
jgi:glutathione S-transferase